MALKRCCGGKAPGRAAVGLLLLTLLGLASVGLWQGVLNRKKKYFLSY